MCAEARRVGASALRAEPARSARAGGARRVHVTRPARAALRRAFALAAVLLCALLPAPAGATTAAVATYAALSAAVANAGVGALAKHPRTRQILRAAQEGLA
jgi:hypothetical protein